jgi:hypothetical protein
MSGACVNYWHNKRRPPSSGLMNQGERGNLDLLAASSQIKESLQGAIHVV